MSFTLPMIFPKRRGSAVVWAIFGLAISVVTGVLVFALIYPELDGLRDDTFSAEANTTIGNVETEFYDAVDLLLVAFVVIAIVAIVGYIAMIRRATGA